MKTSELTGSALDWAVAKANGTLWLWEDLSKPCPGNEYSTDWAQGGPIIERGCLDLYCDHAGVAWRARKMLGGLGPMSGGPTPLIAAMRCYVASKLGDKIEIPEELK